METMTLLGMYYHNDKIFNDMMLPASMDREAFISGLIDTTAGLEVLYPDPDILKIIIDRWSQTRIGAWNKINTALSTDYDMLSNKRLTTTEHVQSTGANSAAQSVSQTGNQNDTATNVHNVGAFNSNTPKQSTADNNTDAVTTSQNGTTSANGTNNSATDFTHTEAGSIGVITSQELLSKELEFRKTDIYAIIINEFKDRFCLLLY